MPIAYFICYGNICRSPFAEHYARKAAPGAGLSGWSFGSAGIGATPGLGSPKPALVAADRLGVDLRPHRALHVDDLRVDPQDLLVAMDRHVFGQLATGLASRLEETRGPGGAALRLMMQELAEPGAGARPVLDVPDPMGLGVPAYEASYALLVRAVDRLLARLAAGA